jgi:hypothetical protein
VVFRRLPSRVPSGKNTHFVTLEPNDNRPNAMKLPEGWRVWALVLVLNAAAGYLWFLDRNMEAPMTHSGIGDWLRSLGI